MRILWLLVLSLYLTLACHAGTNTLVLTWALPPGYTSTLYCSTNLGSGWSLLSTNAPPYTTEQTNQMAFFTVIVAPPLPSITSSNYAGGAPTLVPTADTAVTIDTYDGSLWEWFDGSWH